MGFENPFKRKPTFTPEEAEEARKKELRNGILAAGALSVAAAGAFETSKLPEMHDTRTPAAASDTIQQEKIATAGMKSTDAPQAIRLDAKAETIDMPVVDSAAPEMQTIDFGKHAVSIEIDTPQKQEIDLGKHSVTIEMPER